MMKNSDNFWESCWQKTAELDYFSYAEPYFRMESDEIEIFRKNNIHTVCDAGCGFGAYTLAYISGGFNVRAFDISETAVNITRRLLEHYGLAADELKTASILETGYDSDTFDGVVSYSVIDHMTLPDAKKALAELYRITKNGGLIMLALDTADGDDLVPEHVILDDGSILYTSPAKNGMIFHPYNEAELVKLLNGKKIIYRNTGRKGEIVVILQK